MMDKDIITSKQIISMMITLIAGSTLLISGASEAKQDTWISILLGMVMVLPMILVYVRIVKLYPNKNLFDIIEEVLGKIIGKIINLLFVWYFFYLGALVIRNITEFIQIVSFPETPQFFVAFFIGVLIIYTVRCGVEVLGRLIEFVLPFIILTVFITVFLSIPKMDIKDLKPVLYNGWKPILKSAFILFSSLFTDTVVFIALFGFLDQKKSSPNKIYFSGLFIGTALMLLVIFRNILNLGIPNISHLYYPSYAAVSVISLGEFLQRIEVFISLTLFIIGYVKLSICSFATSIGIAKLFNLDDYREIVAPLTLLMLYLSFILYDNAMEMFEFVNYNAYYKLLFQVVLPLIIWIVAEIKTQSSKSKII